MTTAKTWLIETVPLSQSSTRILQSAKEIMTMKVIL
jgi:hypothetical protein